MGGGGEEGGRSGRERGWEGEGRRKGWEGEGRGGREKGEERGGRERGREKGRRDRGKKGKDFKEAKASREEGREKGKKGAVGTKKGKEGPHLLPVHTFRKPYMRGQNSKKKHNKNIKLVTLNCACFYFYLQAYVWHTKTADPEFLYTGYEKKNPSDPHFEF